MKDKQHFRRLMVGGSMILAPILAIGSWLAWPTLTSEGAEFVAETLDVGRTRVIWSTVLGAVSVALAVVAVMGLVHLLHDRREALGSAGGGLSIVGLVLIGTTFGLGFAAAETAFSDLAMSQKVALFETLAAGPAFVLIAIGGIVMALGTIGLSLALGRARVVPLPSAYLFGAFAIVQVVGFALYSAPVVIASFVMLAAALIPVGLEVLMETGESWEHPPVFEGYHMAGAHP